MHRINCIKKALKAFFKLKKDFISLSPNVKSTINVFEHTIKPMFRYGSEIWGYFNPFSKKNCQKRDLHWIQFSVNVQMCEKMHIKFCKSLLGIYTTSTNFAVLSKFGRFPIHFDILKAMLSDWHSLENHDPDCSSLLNNAFVESKYLFHKKCPSWYGLWLWFQIYKEWKLYPQSDPTS